VHFLLLGHDTFAEPLRRLGHQVTTCSVDPGADLPVDDPDPDWSLIQRLIRGRGCQAVLVTDDVGYRQMPCGLWRSELPVAFYGVDSPLNRFWQRPYARLFDLAWLDQPAEAEDLAAVHPRAQWLPVAVDPARYQGPPADQVKDGVCFVGVVDPRVRPKRSAVLERVARVTPLTVAGGRRGRWVTAEQAATMYRAHQVVLNENLFTGFTTRPLEVMAAGGCLLSEAAPGAMDRCFQHLEHLAYFDGATLEQMLRKLLGDAALRRRLSEQGRAAVLAGHGLEHRAEVIAAALGEMARTPWDRRRRLGGGDALLAEGQALTMAGLRWPAKNGARRLLRGTGRTAAAASDGADPCQGPFLAGLGAAARQDHGRALELLARAARCGGADQRLALGLAAHQAGRPQLARQALAPLAAQYPGLEQAPGEAEFHLAAAALLQDLGRDMRPGFNGAELDPVLWSALEHLRLVAKQQRDDPRAWQRMGEILLARGAAWEAHHCLRAALAAGAGEAAKRRLAQAAQQGFVLP